MAKTGLVEWVKANWTYLIAIIGAAMCIHTALASAWESKILSTAQASSKASETILESKLNSEVARLDSNDDRCTLENTNLKVLITRNTVILERLDSSLLETRQILQSIQRVQRAREEQ